MKDRRFCGTIPSFTSTVAEESRKVKLDNLESIYFWMDEDMDLFTSPTHEALLARVVDWIDCSKVTGADVGHGCLSVSSVA